MRQTKNRMQLFPATWLLCNFETQCNQAVSLVAPRYAATKFGVMQQMVLAN